MKRSTRWTAVALAVAGALAVSAAQAQQPKVNWKMQSAFGSQLTHLGVAATRLVKDVEDMTDGNFVIKFHEPGALVPVLECFDAASKGSVDACGSPAGNYAGKYAALSFFTAVPVGPGSGELPQPGSASERRAARVLRYDVGGASAADEVHRTVRDDAEVPMRAGAAGPSSGAADRGDRQAFSGIDDRRIRAAAEQDARVALPQRLNARRGRLPRLWRVPSSPSSRISGHAIIIPA